MQGPPGRAIGAAANPTQSPGGYEGMALEHQLWDVKNNKKGFYKYIGQKGKGMEGVQDGHKERDLVITEMEKAEVLNELFASVFTGSQASQSLKGFCSPYSALMQTHLEKEVDLEQSHRSDQRVGTLPRRNWAESCSAWRTDCARETFVAFQYLKGGYGRKSGFYMG
ncbi:hypothetical protein DUI87_09787 [Hirundo rustica rustica]|uniref:Uncharacterized protein n=1 Tax=Hirundo rustica rustica TaxID=333673 RepID=A0A3M0KGS6_HIRRU|nr:hypothetical protein DUI87_09787 [Hirundo rustica rustica]